MAAGHRVDAGRWDAAADRLLDRIAGRFLRVETRRRAGRFVHGLLADLPRKNCWAIAEQSSSWSPAAPEPARAPGQTGDDAINTAPEQATTDVRRQPNDSRNDLRLES